MKVSKNLLKTIALGISVSALTTSCTLFEELKDEDKKDQTEEQHETNEDDKCWENCPACGMG